MKTMDLITGISILANLLLIAILFSAGESEAPTKPDNKRFIHEIDSLNFISKQLVVEKNILTIRLQKSDSIIANTKPEIVIHKNKINENSAAILNLSSDSTINLFTREITGDSYKRQ